MASTVHDDHNYGIKVWAYSETMLCKNSICLASGLIGLRICLTLIAGSLHDLNFCLIDDRKYIVATHPCQLLQQSILHRCVHSALFVNYFNVLSKDIASSASTKILLGVMRGPRAFGSHPPMSSRHRNLEPLGRWQATKWLSARGLGFPENPTAPYSTSRASPFSSMIGSNYYRMKKRATPWTFWSNRISSHSLISGIMDSISWLLQNSKFSRAGNFREFRKFAKISCT